MQLFFRHPDTPQTARRCPGTIRCLPFPARSCSRACRFPARSLPLRR